MSISDQGIIPISSHDGFHSTWLTVRDHRIFVDHRTGFPSPEDKRIAELAATFVEYKCSPDARVIHIFFDDKAGQYCITVASTEARDSAIVDDLPDALWKDFYNAGFAVWFNLVPPGYRASNRYNHMEYLSAACGLTTT